MPMLNSNSFKVSVQRRNHTAYLMNFYRSLAIRARPAYARQVFGLWKKAWMRRARQAREWQAVFIVHAQWIMETESAITNQSTPTKPKKTMKAIQLVLCFGLTRLPVTVEVIRPPVLLVLLPLQQI